MSQPLLVKSKLICVALNDAAQLKQLDATFNEKPYGKPPTEPVLYYKPRNTWAADGATVEWAVDFDGNSVDSMVVGASLGVVIGKEACRVTEVEALDAVAGYTIVGDYSLPEQTYFRPDIKGKCLDGSAPVGPVVAEVATPNAVEVIISVNGAEQSRFSYANLERSVETLISKLSYIMTLQPGEVIAVGFAGERTPVAPGDKVELSIDGIGTLTSTLGAKG